MAAPGPSWRGLTKLSDLTPEPDEEATRRISAFLAGLPSDPAALMAAFGQMQTAEEAELAAQGIHPVSVVHGDLESADDEKLIYGPDGLHALAGRAALTTGPEAGTTTPPGSSTGPAPSRPPSHSSPP